MLSIHTSVLCYWHRKLQMTLYHFSRKPSDRHIVTPPPTREAERDRKRKKEMHKKRRKTKSVIETRKEETAETGSRRKQ